MNEMEKMSRDNLRAAVAKHLGWKFSSAHGGYINDQERNGKEGNAGYVVAETAEEACRISGVESDSDLMLEAAAAMRRTQL